MKLIEIYNKLKTTELIILWVMVFIFILLIGISINLYLKNKELKLLLKIKEKEILNNNKDIKQEKNLPIEVTKKITKQLQEELKPQTIELTDYEQKQEEEAIISYEELLNNSSDKDKVYNLDDNKETDDFIKELKSFRNSL